jgi:2',3'-cyclic-nucleotide 2'-phosphodiesterase (5'-nucleotidase family)
MKNILRFWIISALLFAGCSHKLRITLAANMLVAENAPADSGAVHFLQPWKDSLTLFTSAVIALSDSAILHQKPTGPLGNLCADLVLRYGDSALNALNGQICQAAALNHGGLRNTLPAGNITVGDIFELMPFENELVLLQLRGTAMDSLLMHIISRGGEPVAGIRIFNDSANRRKITVGGMAFDSRREYWIVSSDYLAQGGDAFFMLTTPLQRIDLKTRVRDVLISQMAKESSSNGKLLPRNEGRIHLD